MEQSKISRLSFSITVKEHLIVDVRDNFLFIHYSNEIQILTMNFGFRILFKLAYINCIFSWSI